MKICDKTAMSPGRGHHKAWKWRARSGNLQGNRPQRSSIDCCIMPTPASSKVRASRWKTNSRV